MNTTPSLHSSLHGVARLGLAGLLAPALPFAAVAVATSPAVPVTLTVQAGAAGLPISPVLYGVFFEDINYAADGGLYAEMVQNRSFEYYPLKNVRHDAERAGEMKPLTAWQTVERGGLKARAEASILQPLHPRNPTYLVLTLSGSNGAAGIANLGYDGGLPIADRATYDCSLYARHLDGHPGPISLALEAPDGTVLARAEIAAAGPSFACAIPPMSVQVLRLPTQ
jgi:hypothetical protein